MKNNILKQDLENEDRSRLGRASLCAIVGGSVLFWTALSCSPQIDSPDSVDAIRGESFEHRFEASNNSESFGARNLPDGLALPDQSESVIAGTPTNLGAFQTTLTATNQFGTGSKSVEINVIDPRTSVDSARELMITHPSVLTDRRATSPDGEWHIATTIRRITGSNDNQVNSRFILNWLRQWESVERINDDPADDVRSSISSRIIEPWIRASGGNRDELDWAEAPFRLNAIVNRVDLTRFQNDDIEAEVEKLGEARLVYADRNGGSFHAIFEFGIPGPATRANVVQWARQWRNLSQTNGFGEDYKSALAEITRQFVTRATMAPDRGQLRTNEIFFRSPWQLREFKLRNGNFQQEIVAMTPQQRFNQPNNATLIAYLQQNQADILAGRHSIPRRFNGQPFAGGVSNTPSPGFQWNVDSDRVPEPVRFQFSRNTCNGCHGGDGPGRSFVHIRNVRDANQRNVLSPFLLEPQQIPGGGTHDEMEGRRVLLAALDADQSEVRLTPMFQTESLRRARIKNIETLHEYCRRELKIRRNRPH